MGQLASFFSLPFKGMVWLAGVFLIYCLFDPLIWAMDKLYGTVEDWEKEKGN